MRLVITLATVLVLSCVHAMPGLSKECWENRPTVTPIDCCKDFTILPESELDECTQMYPEEEEEQDLETNTKDEEKNEDENDEEDEDDDDDDDEDDDLKIRTTSRRPRPHPHHHHHHKRHHHGRHHCIVECYFNKTGAFKDRQVIKETALKLFSDNLQSVGTWRNQLSTSIDACIAEMDETEKLFKEMLAKGDFPHPHTHPHPPHHGGKGKHCHPKASHFTKCVERHAFKNCPAERRVSSAECSKLAEHMEKCAPPKFPGIMN